MNIRMLETRRGSEDGFCVRCFEAGKEYTLADGLARAFLASGSAKEIKPKKTTRKKESV